MPFFSTKSLKELDTCNKDIKTIATEAIKIKDFSISNGHRSCKSQFELFKKGREFKNGFWLITDKLKVVTFKNGITKIGLHNIFPSSAFDILPYPFNGWEKTQDFIDLGKHILKTANRLKKENKIQFKLFWGGWWKMRDYVHFQLTV